jgi:ABC-2 type transport system ATP-binding protein
MVSGPVHDVLVQEDVVELSASDNAALNKVAADFPGINNLVSSEHFVQLYFPKGEADLSRINQYFFEKGIILSHLILKRKRLEEKFFELTGNS